jgi:hypothetical protein
MKPLPGSTADGRRRKGSVKDRGKGVAVKVRGLYRRGVAKYRKASLKGKVSGEADDVVF